jgi:hypothetical protein
VSETGSMDIVGFDVGTGNLVSAKYISDDKAEIRSMRNMFLSVDPDFMTATDAEQSQWEHVKSYGKNGELEKIFILNQDAYTVANMFNYKVQRPMSNGVISPSEIDAYDVVAKMIEKMIGKTKNGVCVYSIPASAVDVTIPPVDHHKRVFEKILKSLGYIPHSINEGMAVIYANCKSTGYTGIGISYGCGLTNIACSYKGKSVLEFSIGRGGDWIDETAGSAVNIISNRMCAFKEKKLNLNGNDTDMDKKSKHMNNALINAYTSLIEYTLNNIIDEFEDKSDGLSIDESIPIIISGGTSLPNGFIELFKEIFEQCDDFPYDISEIRRAEDPLSGVAIGAMKTAYWQSQTGNKKETKKEK